MRDTAVRDAEILRLYHDGALLKDIAKAVGVAPNTISVILPRLGIARPTKLQKRWRDRPDETSKILALWESGLCVSQIAERIGGNWHSVENVIKRLKCRKPGTIRHRYDNAAVGGSGRDGFAANMARKT